MMLSTIRNSAKWAVWLALIAIVITIPVMYGSSSFGLGDTEPWAVKVNGEEISYDEIENAYTAQLQKAGGELSDTASRDLYRQVIDGLVSERLAMAAARKAGCAPTSQEIIRALQRQFFSNQDGTIDMQKFNAARYQLSAAQWRQYEEYFRQQMTLEKAAGSITAGLTITPGMLHDYFNVRYQRVRARALVLSAADLVSAAAVRRVYDSRPDSFYVAERVKGRHILFGSPSFAQSSDEAKLAYRERALAAQIRLQSGAATFEQLYREALADTSGLVLAQPLDWFERGQMVPEFETVAFRQPVNKVSEIIETPFGFHLAVFDAHEMRHRMGFEKAAELIRAELTTDSEIEAAQGLAESLRARLEKGEDFAALAAANSRGPARARGGLLGDVVPGELAAEYYPDSSVIELLAEEIGVDVGGGRSVIDPGVNRALVDLDPGKVSDVIPSVDGIRFFLIKVEGKRPGDPALWIEVQESIAGQYKNALQQRIFADWVQSLKASARIEYSEATRNRLNPAP